MYLTILKIRADWSKSVSHEIPKRKPAKTRIDLEKARRIHFDHFLDELLEEENDIPASATDAIAEWMMGGRCGSMLKIDGDYKKRPTIIFLLTDKEPEVSMLKKKESYVPVSADWQDDDEEDEEDDSDDEEEEDEEEDEKPRSRRGPTKC